ncbi:hypothetical protein [Streptomyces sp. NPDC058335]|uniref:hypothetical protein n=1 Tax=Streptomyces sp. NPDC058335 TaxID=3346451 RepID=UPI00365134EC
MDNQGPVPVLAVPPRRGAVEQHPSDDTNTWEGEESGLSSTWADGASGGWIELVDFLARAGLRLAPNAEVCTTSPIDGGT